MTEETREFMDTRKLLLDFYSAEIQAHSRLMIGFSALLFVASEVTLKLPSHVFGWILYFIVFWTVATALWYSLLRLLAYGSMSNSVVHIRDSEIRKMRNRRRSKDLPISSVLACVVLEKTKHEKILFKMLNIPAYHLVKGDKQRYGLIWALVFAFFTTLCVILLKV